MIHAKPVNNRRILIVKSALMMARVIMGTVYVNIIYRRDLWADVKLKINPIPI